VNVPVEAFYWRRLTVTADHRYILDLNAADERKHDVKMTSRMTEQHQYGKPDRKRKAKWNLFFEIFFVIRQL